MIQSSTTWNGQAAQTVVLDAAWDGILRATVYYFNSLQTALNVPNPGKRVKRKRTTRAGPKGSTYTIYPEPSLPGQPPRKRTGALADAVLYEVDRARLATRTGVLKNVIYGLYLEFGTRRMAARPWLLATLNKIFPQLKAIAESGKTV